MHKNAFLIAALMAALVLPACMEQPAPAPAPAPVSVRIRGTIDSLNGQTLAVKTRDGGKATIALAPNYIVRTVVRRRLSDIKAGDFVASTSLRGKDGKLHAIEVHIFLPAQRGVVPELQVPWDRGPDSVMTNAIVTGIAKAPSGRVLSLTYKGNPTEVIVGPNIPIVTYAPGNPGMLLPGKAVFVIALKKDDGSLSASQVTVESHGVKPPM
ncbi:MAG TPA: hypothetical protein VN795_01210 [Stellaceae bacterium]|nr:hypothetical protein [Stellaceae bacterium]